MYSWLSIDDAMLEVVWSHCTKNISSLGEPIILLIICSCRGYYFGLIVIEFIDVIIVVVWRAYFFY